MRKLFQALALLAALCSADCSAAGCGGWCTQRAHALRTGDPAVAVSVFVCSNLFLLLGFSTRFSARFGGAAAKLLRLPPAAGSAFLLGLLGGYPAGAQAVGVLYTRGELSEPDAERALAVCNQSGPSFIFGVLGGAVFKSAAAGAFLYAVQIISAVLVCRLTAKKQPTSAKSAAKLQQPESFAAAFSESVRRAGMNAIQICMFVTVFSVLSRYFLLAAGRFPAVRGTAVVPRYAGTVRRLRGADRLRACASLEAVHCISAFVLRRHKCSGTEPGRRAGVQAERKAAPAVQGASGCAFLHAHAHCRTAAARGKLARCRAFRRGEPGNDRGSVTSSLCGKSSAVSQKVP